MKKTKNIHQYFAIDESGDPVFFNHKKENIIGKGASRILILGFVTTQDVDKLRSNVNYAKKKILDDKLLSKKISDKQEFFFHAKVDQADVKKVFIDILINSEFKCQFIVARKKEINRFEEFTNSKVKNQNNVQVQIPIGEPLLQVIDYMLWIIYRCYTKPHDKSAQAYLEVLKDKISLVYDVYNESEDNKLIIFNKKNQFHPTKITPLELDLYCYQTDVSDVFRY